MAHSGIVDSGIALQIIPNTRTITVPNGYEVIGTEGDHQSEVLTIKCPSVIDGHDVSKCMVHYISWVNAAGKPGRTPIQKEDIRLDSDGNIVFPWVITAPITERAGNISFAFHIVDVDANNTLLYKWSTTACKALRVLETVSHSTDDESEDVVVFIDIDKRALMEAVSERVGGVLNG